MEVIIGSERESFGYWSTMYILQMVTLSMRQGDGPSSEGDFMAEVQRSKIMKVPGLERALSAYRIAEN